MDSLKEPETALRPPSRTIQGREGKSALCFSLLNSDARGLLRKSGAISVLNQSLQSFSEKVRIVHSLGFGGQMIPLETTQLYVKADNMETNSWDCVPVKLYIWTLKFEFHIMFTCHEMFSI